MSNQVEGLWAAKIHGKWTGEESHSHDRSPLAAWGLWSKDRARVRVITSEGHEDSGWGTQRERDLYACPNLPQSLLQRWLMGFLRCSVCSPRNIVLGEEKPLQISAWHTAVMQGGNNSEKPNLMGLSLYKIPWLPEIKCNSECVINVTQYFFSHG